MLTFALICIAGIVLGLLGGGGAVILVPVLVYFEGIPAAEATSYSLFAVGISSFLGAYLYYKNGHVHLKDGLFFLGPAALGTYLVRTFVLPGLPEVIWIFPKFQLGKDQLVLLVLACVLIYSASGMLVTKKAQGPSKFFQVPLWIPFLSIGFAAGCLIGFVGAGGGFLFVPMLLKAASQRSNPHPGLETLAKGDMNIKTAVGTSLGIISINALSGSLFDHVSGQYPLNSQSLIFASCMFSGTYLGTLASERLPVAILKRSFAYLLLALAVFLLYKILAPIYFV